MKLLKVSCTAVSLLTLAGGAHAAEVTVNGGTADLTTGAVSGLSVTVSNIAKTDLSTDLTNEIEGKAAQSDIGDVADLNTTSKEVVGAINEVKSNVGSLSSLTTQAKSSVVASINEIDTQVGDLTNLKTNQKTSLVGSINEVASNVTEIETTIGDLSGLEGNARNKTSVVAALNAVDTVVRQNTDNIGRNSQRIDTNTANIATNSANIAGNTSRIVSLEEDVSELRSGVAMAVAIANAPVVSGGKNGISVSGGIGHFQGKTASAVKLAYSPTDTMAINTSVATDFDGGVTAGAGVGFAF